MSWGATAYAKKVRECPNGELITKSEKLLFMVMADYYNEERGASWAGVKTLAGDALMRDRKSVV